MKERTKRPALVRFMEKVAIDGDGCWIWTAAQFPSGYGNFSYRDNGVSRWVCAHKWLWEHENGPTPEGMELDHLCRNRQCVRPDHLEPVTHTVNVMRGLRGRVEGMCARGHDALVNPYIRRDGRIECRECKKIAKRKHYWKRDRMETQCHPAPPQERA